MVRVHIVVVFTNGSSRSFPVFEDGDWTDYGGEIPTIVVRPHGKGSHRYHIPLHNVLYFEVVFP